jgi:hypothetical protein
MTKAKGKGEDEKKPTKKAVILKCLEKGATIEQMAKQIERLGIDADHDKNCRVVTAWLRKMGYDTRKDSITKDPTFRKDGKRQVAPDGEPGREPGVA